jgi:hypothetical protein
MPRRKIDWLYWPDTVPPSDDADDNLIRDGVASRPDIEDTTLIDWGLEQSELVESGSTVDLLCMEGATPCEYSATVIPGYHTYEPVRLGAQC